MTLAASTPRVRNLLIVAFLSGKRISDKELAKDYALQELVQKGKARGQLTLKTSTEVRRLIDIDPTWADAHAKVKEENKTLLAKLCKEKAEKRGNATKFRFEGTCRHCSSNEPHAPHVTDTYPTVRNGTGQYYCLGKEGDTSSGQLTINIRNRHRGNEWGFGSASGYFFFAEEVTA
jgi:hypothetical protein